MIGTLELAEIGACVFGLSVPCCRNLVYVLAMEGSEKRVQQLIAKKADLDKP